MVEGRKKITRMRSFHLRYLEICRSKNFTPAQEVRAKNNDTTMLDFFGDKLKIDDWISIIESLYHDQILRNIAIRMRKMVPQVQENVDTEKRARLFKGVPVIFTKFVFTGITEAIMKVLQSSHNITTLALEALPLDEKYSTCIAKALAANDSLHTISFCRSPIGDKGCDILCNTIKYLPHIENVYLCNCFISTEGAGYVADMIKFQKIYRFSEGWKNSLRYREVDPDSLPGLRMIFIAQNPKIGDEGARTMTEILKEDVWIKAVDMADCGLTDVGAKFVLGCLKINRSIVEFNVRSNLRISPQILQQIQVELGKAPEEHHVKPNSKQAITNLREKVKLLEEMAYTEKQLRKQAELFNEQLHEQVKSYERQLQESQKLEIPEGCIVIEQETMDTLIKERNDLRRALDALKSQKSKPKPTHIRKMKVRKARSEIASKKLFESINDDKHTKSEHEMTDSKRPSTWVTKTKHKNNSNIYIERNIGDTHQTEITRQELVASKNMMGIEALRIFMKQSRNDDRKSVSPKPLSDETARSLFLGKTHR